MTEHKVEINFTENLLVVNAESSLMGAEQRSEALLNPLSPFFCRSKEFIDCLLLENLSFENAECNEKVIQTYFEFLDACMHENLMNMFFYRRHAGERTAATLL